MFVDMLIDELNQDPRPEVEQVFDGYDTTRCMQIQ
jgi:hypothetical protein